LAAPHSTDPRWRAPAPPAACRRADWPESVRGGRVSRSSGSGLGNLVASYDVDQHAIGVFGDVALAHEPGLEIGFLMIHKGFQAVEHFGIERIEMGGDVAADQDVHFLGAAMVGAIEHALATRHEVGIGHLCRLYGL